MWHCYPSGRGVLRQPAGRAASPGRAPRLALERLEERCLLTTYAITDLGNLSASGNPDLTSFATGINDSGTVVGYSQTDEIIRFPDGNRTNNIHAFISSDGQLTDLGDILYDPSDPNTKASEAFGINSSGEVVGSTGIMDEVQQGMRSRVEFHPVHPFVYDPSAGTVTLLSPLSWGGPDAIAAAINDAGVVVGRSEIPVNPACPNGSQGVMINFRAVYWNAPDPTAIEIPPLTSGDQTGYESHALAVDPAGQVFGDSSIGDPSNPCAPPLAFSWTPGATDSVNLNDVFGAMESRVYGVNAFDQVVGFFGDHDPGIAFVLNNDGQYSTIHVLYRGDLYNVAYSINGTGQVVGVEGDDAPQGGFQPNHAFVWMPFQANGLDGGVYDLYRLLADTTGWSQLTTATAINDSGLIVGQGTTDAGQTHAVLLIPFRSSRTDPGRLTVFARVDPLPGPAAAFPLPSTVNDPASSPALGDQSAIPFSLGGAEPLASSTMVVSSVPGTHDSPDGGLIWDSGQPAWLAASDGALSAGEWAGIVAPV